MDGSVVGIKHERREGTCLCRSVPTVRTMHQHARAFPDSLTSYIKANQLKPRHVLVIKNTWLSDEDKRDKNMFYQEKPNNKKNGRGTRSEANNNIVLMQKDSKT